MMSDITERKDMEHQLLRSQKLESIGHLAAGIAHEINTPTQYIVDNTNFLKDAFSDINKLLEKYSQLYEKSKSGSITPELIAEIDVLAGNADIDYLVEEIPNAINQSLEGLDRVKKIVYAMKNFSHPDNEDKKFVDINESIKNTIDIARNEWKYIARVKTDFDSSLTSVPCFPGDFNQVILNLIVNAAHAIGGASDNGSEAKGTISISTRCDGEWAEIRVSDTGTGIPEHIRSMIFDPFFTTKEVGKGTGQGLPLVHSTVVGKHNGTITLDTELGKGTTFIIRLPLCSSSSEILTSETV
ncbi:MAG: two component histidine kinase [Candidatus Scalindua brodae]|uniref:histidine kinase n=1 Tax=Candidatus Scalindua brodae TaxID=237368 RepID=A0A0B0EIR7_9BACT|nr:MAG: two component histidine kinase [Candidatus Scalindua brodae]